MKNDTVEKRAISLIHAGSRTSMRAVFSGMLFFSLAVLLALFTAVPGLSQAPTSEDQPIAAQSDDDSLTLEQIIDELAVHLSQVRDVTATLNVSFMRDDSEVKGELALAAIFPDLIRATWVQPEFYSGMFYILDAEEETYTEYWPAIGEARKLPLYEVLDNQSPIPLTPDQLFSLPSQDEFNLELSQVENGGEVVYALVTAVDKQTGETFRVWVDTEKWIVTQVESLSPEGRVELSAKAVDIEINQDLNEAFLRRLPPGTVQRRFP